MKFLKPLNLFKEMKRIQPWEHRRLLGLCINDKHMDLAISDPDNMYAVPLSVYRHEGNMDLMAHRFRTLIIEHELVGFVVDYSSYERSMTRSNGTTIQNFMNDMCKTGKFEDINYTYWEEDLIATKNMDFLVMHHVGFILENLNLPQIQAKEIVDKFVAARLLQGYLDFVHTELEKDDFLN